MDIPTAIAAASPTADDVQDALRPIASLISKSEKAQQKLALGTWQHAWSDHPASLCPLELLMVCTSFIWEPGVYDAEFHQLNALIDQVAQSLPGFLGAESWQSADGTRRCASYYWADLATLQAFSIHPTHLEAKRQYSRWYNGYHIVVSEIMRSYGDGALPHVTPNERRRQAA